MLIDNFVFVDAENVGANVIRNIPFRSNTTVFVFSKLLKIDVLSQALGFKCISNYPKGTNQADFHIIGLLGMKIAEYRNRKVEKIQFTLYSHDKGLIAAFKNQCKMGSVKVKIVSPNPNPTSKRHLSPEARILSALKTPQKLNHDLWGKLQLTQSEFSKTVTELIRTGMIFRSTERKKYWIARKRA